MHANSCTKIDKQRGLVDSKCKQKFASQNDNHLVYTFSTECAKIAQQLSSAV